MKRKAFRANSGFSMTEILVVVTIMGVLSALAVTSFSSLRSVSLTAAGNQLVDAMAMARQNSLSRNDYTAVVILTSGSNACSGYCLLELPSQQDGSRGSAWTALTPWRFLPKGIVFERGQGTDTFVTTSLNSATQPPMLPLALPTSFPVQGQPVDLTSAAIVQCFQPDGTLIGGQSLTLRLIEGAADTSGNTTYTGATVSGNEVSYYDLYFVGNTGTAQIGRP